LCCRRRPGAAQQPDYRHGAVAVNDAIRRPFLFLLFDASMKVLKLPAAVEGTTQLGYPESVIVPLGVLQLLCLALYLFPRTSVLGAILWTGYLGGAIATHVRLQNPLFTHVLFPIYVAVLLWGGLWLRDDRLRSLVPLRR
jgi:DoxX-like family